MRWSGPFLLPCAVYLICEAYSFNFRDDPFYFPAGVMNLNRCLFADGGNELPRLITLQQDSRCVHKVSDLAILESILWVATSALSNESWS